MSLIEAFYQCLRWKPSDLADMLPWVEPIDTGIILLKSSNSLMRSYRVVGLDWEGQTQETIGVLMMQANDALKRLGGEWTMQAEAKRRPITQYPTRTSGYPVANLIEHEKVQDIVGQTSQGTSAYTTDYYTTLIWTPPLGYQQVLHDFRRSCDQFIAHMQSLVAEMEPLDDDTYTHLHSTISDRPHRVLRPQPHTDLSRYLRDTSWDAGGYPEWDARLGALHVRVLTLTGYPASSWAGMLARLERLPVAYRWCTYWSGIEKHLQDGILSKRQHHWIGQEKSVGDYLKESVLKDEVQVINDSATRKAEGLSLSRQEIESDIYGVGQFATTIITWGQTADEADRHVSLVQHTLEESGFVAKREGHYGARMPIVTWLLQFLVPPNHTGEWLGTIPGNIQDGIRRTLQGSLTLAHLYPGLRTSWSGPDDENVWFTARTETNNIVRIPSQVRDVRHHLYLGVTGSGKSWMLCHNTAQWLMRPKHRACIFDVGRSARLLTLLVGGTWIDLGSGDCRFQPLRHIDQRQELGWALSWVFSMMQEGGIPRDVTVHEYLAERLKEVAALPQESRTMSALLHVCEAHSRRVEPNAIKHLNMKDATADRLMDRLALYRKIQSVLRLFTVQGPYGNMLDGIREDFDTTHMLCFEQQGLRAGSELRNPLIQYCFHVVEKSFSTDRPLLLAMEEAALMAIDGFYQGKYDEWAMTARKYGVGLALVINSFQQTLAFELGKLTEENTPTRFFFPNRQALTPNTAPIYRQFGLTDDEIYLIATGRPYQDVYYVCRELGSRMLNMRTSHIVQDCLGRNTEEDHAMIDQLLDEYGAADFAPAWLRHCGHRQAALDIEQANNQGESHVPMAAALSGTMHV